MMQERRYCEELKILDEESIKLPLSIILSIMNKLFKPSFKLNSNRFVKVKNKYNNNNKK